MSAGTGVAYLVGPEVTPAVHDMLTCAETDSNFFYEGAGTRLLVLGRGPQLEAPGPGRAGSFVGPLLSGACPGMSSQRLQNSVQHSPQQLHVTDGPLPPWPRPAGVPFDMQARAGVATLIGAALGGADTGAGGAGNVSSRGVVAFSTMEAVGLLHALEMCAGGGVV